jgi:hypothetical protein
MARIPDPFKATRGVPSGNASTTYGGSYRATTSSTALRLTGLTAETKTVVATAGVAVLDTRDELLRVIRAALHRWAGPHAMNQLAEALQRAATPTSPTAATAAAVNGGSVARHEFEVIILQLTGETMSRAQCTALTNFYLTPSPSTAPTSPTSGSVDYHAFIRDLAIGTSGRRLAIVRKVFDKLRSGKDYVTVATLLASFNAKNHPDVLRKRHLTITSPHHDCAITPSHRDTQTTTHCLTIALTFT